MKLKKRIILGITGASGVIYGIRCLEVLNKIAYVETHLVISDGADKTIAIETEYNTKTIRDLADFVHTPNDMAASISSGSFLTSGMIVCPCSMKTLSGIVNSYNDNLLIRAADVMLKEGRQLIVVPRETPLHKGHLQLLTRLTDLGGIVIPPIPGFYHHPQTIDDIIDHTIGKILDQFSLQHELFDRWHGPEPL